MTKRTLLSLLAVPVSAALLAAPLQATSIATPADHDPAYACADIDRVLGVINRADDAYNALPLFTIHDDFGKVDPDERDAFYAAMRTSEGKRDRDPMMRAALYRLNDDSYNALYVLQTKRIRWREKRWVETDMLIEEQVDDPHWSIEHDYWLVHYSGHRITEMRQGNFYHLTRLGKRAEKTCRVPVEVPVSALANPEEAE